MWDFIVSLFYCIVDITMAKEYFNDVTLPSMLACYGPHV